MELSNLDLNLLPSLNALLQERSVTRAAERLYVGQPAMSTRLARLRQQFDDELLVREGQNYVLTPFAVQLLKTVELAMGGLHRVFAEQRRFEPRTAELKLRIAMSDYAQKLLARPLSVFLEREAPNTTVTIDLFNGDAVRALPGTLRGVDAVVVPHGIIPEEYPHLDLYSDRWVCLVSPDNTRVHTCVTSSDLAELSWVVSHEISPASIALRMHGIEARRRLVVDGFTAVPDMVAGTDRIAIVPYRVAQQAANFRDLRVLDCPLPLPELVESFWWHPAHQNSSSHRWFRYGLVETVRSMIDEPTSTSAMTEAWSYHSTLVSGLSAPDV